MDLPQKRFHGWNILGACFIISLLVGGLMPDILKYIYSIGEELGWGSDDASLAMGAVMIQMFIFVLLIGWLVDREGSKKLILVGTLLAGAGMMLLAFVSNVQSYIFVSIFIVAGGYAASGIPTDVLLLRWFKRKRGLAIAVVLVGESVGSGIFWLWMILDMQSYWRISAILIGAVGLAVTIPLVIKLIRNRPSDMSLHPDGIESDDDMTTEPIGHTLKEACRTRSFWLITGGLFLAKAVFLPIETYWSRYFADEISHAPGTIFMLYTIAAVLVVPGTILLGLIADRWDSRKAFVLAISFVGVGILLFAASSHIFMIALLVLVYGMSSKCLFLVSPIIIADSHGLHRFGIISAVVGLVSGVGRIVGGTPFNLLLGKITPVTRVSSDIRLFFAFLIPLALLSALCIYKAKPLSPNPEA